MLDVAGIRWATVAVIGVVLLASGPLVGAVDLTPERRDQTVGDGTAAAALTSNPTDGLRIDRGRFGTNVSYLRIPPIRVDVRDVTGRPRLLAKLRVPALGFDRSATRVLSSDTAGPVVLRLSPRAFTPDRIANDTYRGRLTVRVQSFERDTVIVNRSVTIPVTYR
jgi:hypothetical protein